MTAKMPVHVLSGDEIESCSHILAASNYRQWISWLQLILDAIPGVPFGPNQRKLQAQSWEQLEAAVRMSQQSVERCVPLDWLHNLDQPPSLVRRKQEQIGSWLVDLAQPEIKNDLARWERQCRKPFIQLTPAQQRPWYREAWRDLGVIVGESSIVLPPVIQLVGPLQGQAARVFRSKHWLGQHGDFLIIEKPDCLAVCQACNYHQFFVNTNEVERF